MKYAIVIILMWIFPFFNCSAQNGYPQLKQKSDSLISRFEKELSKQRKDKRIVIPVIGITQQRHRGLSFQS